jgi:phage terminase small subunit
MALTEKQQRFVAEYLIDLNATQAAIRAGYSAKTAGNIGYEQLGRPDIAEAIAGAKAKRSEKTGINAEWVLKRLADAADADLADLYDDAGALRPVKEWPLAWRKGLVAGVEVEELFEGRGEDRELIGRVRKVKIADRTKHIELIGKHVDVQAFKEKVEHEGALTLTPIIEINGKSG